MEALDLSLIFLVILEVEGGIDVGGDGGSLKLAADSLQEVIELSEGISLQEDVPQLIDGRKSILLNHIFTYSDLNSRDSLIPLKVIEYLFLNLALHVVRDAYFVDNEDDELEMVGDELQLRGIRKIGLPELVLDDVFEEGET